MAVQWFPGHMHLTRKTLAERMKSIDVVVEMLDARLPGSSSNPMLAEITSKKPALKVFNKSDLADPSRMQEWKDFYATQSETDVVVIRATERHSVGVLTKACKALSPSRGTMDKPLRVLICGIPNVGKSTLINTIKGKTAAKTGDEAGVTKNEQRIVIADGFYLYDSPGVLWPRIIVAKSGFNLAASGAVGKNAFDDEEVAYELLEYLQLHYTPELELRYGVRNSQALLPEALLEEIGRKRGALKPGDKLDWQKASEIIIHDFRAGLIGKITLETPSEFKAWLHEGRILDAERQLKKESYLKERMKQKSGVRLK